MKASIIKSGMNYATYRAHIQSLLTENKTTGSKQTPELVEFTQLNEQRMHRNEKQFKLNKELSETLSSKESKEYWVLFAEAWCGDCAQNIPIIHKIAEASDSTIDLKILIKSEHLNEFQNYLTNGAESIPKLIRFDTEKLEELGVWGPRPLNAQAIAEHWKKNKATQTKEEFEKELHLWYAKDRGQQLQSEMNQLLKNN
jgi:hypothetical protein